jgi:RNA polymerase sigma-70 factor (ECF subfamily)
MPPPQTSYTLLEALRQGDKAAGERLVRLYTPYIRGWLRRHLPQPDDVDDETHEVFQVVFEKLPAFEHAGRDGSFRAWLRGICFNRIRMFWRGIPPWRRGPDQERILEQLEDPHSDLSQKWDREHDEHVVRSLLGEIEGEFQSTTWRAFQLLVRDGWKPDVVAAELGITVNAIYLARSHVLRRLREEAAGLVL